MFGQRKAAKAAATVAARLEPFGKKEKPRSHGFETLQVSASDAGDPNVAEALGALILNTARNGDAHQFAATTGAEDSGLGWTTVKERNKPRSTALLKAPSVCFNGGAVRAPWEMSWREPDPTAKARYAAATTIKTARTGATKYTYRPGPRTKSGVLYVDQKQGTIVFRWDIRPYPSPKVADSDPRIFYQEGVRYLKKGRYWLIVKSTAKKVWEAPIYTNNDTGLKYVPSRQWWEYFSLLPIDVAPENFKNQSPNNKVFLVAWMAGDENTVHERKMRSTMVVHFTEIHVRNIDAEDVRVVGALADEDIPVACDKAARYVNA